MYSLTLGFGGGGGGGGGFKFFVYPSLFCIGMFGSLCMPPVYG